MNEKDLKNKLIHPFVEYRRQHMKMSYVKITDKIGISKYQVIESSELIRKLVNEMLHRIYNTNYKKEC